MQSVIHRLDAERAEVELLLNSRTFARTNNLGRFLSFVCEKYFEGATSQIKEYSIAVQALGRPPDFDPQLDTVVRVTAHNLRKRLELYYSVEGADHAVQICLPPGHYVPQFAYREENSDKTRNAYDQELSEFDILGQQSDSASSVSPLRSERVAQISRPPDSTGVAAKSRTRTAIVAATLVSAVLVTAVIYSLWSRRILTKPVVQTTAPGVPLNISDPQIHAMVGSDRAAYVDRSGLSWQSDRFCSEGETFTAAGHTVSGTDEAQLFSSGRRGAFRCGYPVPPGTYEVHLLFAETSGLQENSRNVVFSINGAPPRNLDVVDDAGGDDIATTKIYTDIEPAKDGMIHIDFSSPQSFVNAIEILPGLPHRMLPTRIVTGHSAYRDSAGNLWLPDRYFFGGRLSWFVGDLSKVPDNGLYEWHRFGHFRYVIPVATGAKYTLKLYFLEHWFGIQNGAIGGAGSRIFDVSCNGSMLLKSFDIYREGASGPLVKSFPHIEPTGQGKIELNFTPAVNYPSVSAIEIISE